MDREHEQRKRAYKIWEDEGRPEGQHEDHWKRAEEQHEATEEEAAQVTDANQRASDQFNDRTKPRSPADVRPPTTVAPD
ncbi:DUF2934 domain-containing protein [Rhizobium sp. Root1220]|uniref:DUF2934 domain-containing protein n=1 Tax=Rhizobium sp. Root1220 TaxID=1736432 RepID=UPI0006F39C35|nr:DUF2934 domain-containing protein [Rhizobium sp. Root1220]KQV82131.1 hypothetical protein ASC90_23760 [Rhizobium sp. Root1220]